MFEKLLKNSWIRYLIIFSFLIALGVIFFNSLIDLYLKRNLLYQKVGANLEHPKHLKVVNPLNLSDRQIPPKNYRDIKLKGGEEKIGIWTAPFDWNVTAIHSILLPDETVMTFGSYAIIDKEEKDISENKNEIVIEIDENRNHIQNGTYMIFALNSSNVPSEGKIINLK